jgi:hypothetical protein
MFKIRFLEWEDGEGVTKEITLDPPPTEVDYPEAQLYKVRTTQDGAVVVQRPRRDGRPRRWVWSNYPPTHAAYEAQWRLLESLTYRARMRAGLPGWVEVWEDGTGAGGFRRYDPMGNPVFTRVKLLQAHREPKGSGSLRYGQSFVEFHIEDETYEAF